MELVFVFEVDSKDACCFENERSRNIFLDALKAFFMQNNNMPERIVIYRDGVGDGQLQAVYEHELPQIEETFSKVQEGYA